MEIIFVFILGAVAGSFMNVCIYRLPKGESIITPRSHCPLCGTAIKWYDNVPVLSFLVLRGKCRACKKRISARYIIVETISGFISVFLFIRFGLTPDFFIFWYLSCMLIICSFIDLEIREIPDAITLSGMPIGLFLAALYPPLLDKTDHLGSFLDSFIGIIAGGGSIYLMGFLGEFIFKREAMGGGDVKLLAMIGAFIGWKLVILAFFLAPIFGSIAGIVLKIRRGEDIIPYGPHLSLAALVAVFWGREIVGKLFFM
ncbi:MAG: prepilin peptidase [Candidatus Omnitrophica bacterium]|nr:prepilin peptidase [Candidatus Omnitrophota bacterium]